jgi:hypothetical protein
MAHVVKRFEFPNKAAFALLYFFAVWGFRFVIVDSKISRIINEILTVTPGSKNPSLECY